MCFSQWSYSNPNESSSDFVMSSFSAHLFSTYRIHHHFRSSPHLLYHGHKFHRTSCGILLLHNHHHDNCSSLQFPISYSLQTCAAWIFWASQQWLHHSADLIAKHDLCFLRHSKICFWVATALKLLFQVKSCLIKDAKIQSRRNPGFHDSETLCIFDLNIMASFDFFAFISTTSNKRCFTSFEHLF